MSDAQRYAVWPDPMSRSRSRALESWKSFHFQKLSFCRLQWELATDHWFLNWIWSCMIFYISPIFLCHVTLNLAETSVVKSQLSVPYGAIGWLFDRVDLIKPVSNVRPFVRQGQGDEPFIVRNPAVFKSCLICHLQWELATDHRFLN